MRIQIGANYKYRVHIGEYKAHRIHSYFKDKYLDGNLLKKPKWFDAVCKNPPQSPLTGLNGLQCTNNVELGSKDSNFVSLLSPHAEQYSLNYYKHKWRKYKHKPKAIWERAVAEGAKVIPWPCDIVFPEDKLRDRFYNDHFLEKLRPLGKSQSPNEMNEKSASVVAESMWPNISKSNNSNQIDNEPLLLDGEDVIKYQFELMKGTKLIPSTWKSKVSNPPTEDEAYIIACEKYYKDMKSFQRQAECVISNSKNDISSSDSQVSFSENQSPKECLSNTIEIIDEAKHKEIEADCSRLWCDMETEYIKMGRDIKVEKALLNNQRSTTPNKRS